MPSFRCGAIVPCCLMLIWADGTAGSRLLSGPAERPGRAGFAAVLTGSALALALGALTAAPVGIALVGLAFGGFQPATVLADVRLQQRVEGAGRATPASVASLGTEALTIAVYGGLGSAFGHGTVFALCAVPYLVTAVAVVAVVAVVARGRGRGGVTQ